MINLLEALMEGAEFENRLSLDSPPPSTISIPLSGMSLETPVAKCLFPVLDHWWFWVRKIVVIYHGRSGADD